MKVLQINAVNMVASTGQNVAELSDFLIKCGHTSVVAYSNGPSLRPQNEYRIGSKFDTKLHGLLSRITGKQGYFSKSATRRLLSFIGNFNPDVVVLHNLHANYINLPMLLKFLAKKDIATVVVLHDCWFYTGKCCHYTVEGCLKWQDSCGNCPSLKKHNISWFFDKTTKMLKDKSDHFSSIPRLAVVGVSDWITNEAKKSTVFNNVKFFKRIYNWIDTDTFSSCSADELKEKLSLADKKVILSVAYGWTADKGLNTILEMSKKLTEDEKILLVGDICEDVTLNDNIVHIPTTDSPKKLAQYYSIADVFIQPSLEETFGKVTAEALACGVPVVCFNSTTTPELVSDECGIVLNTFAADSMLSAARRIISEGKGFYSDKCRQSALRLFSKEKNTKEYISVFEELINGRDN